ncbi:hypothetical protein HIM_07203 [Hirsutella minnesotensis 3608]|uniref:Uncharacterized protein n=1 Tax=Hirsutella minnesotensis 3608 TaxID=1043627 RepID=A0A0F8A4D9_9HYPO|nr:hypothetical protein HIM_07203 [Hirsutella minnesotensis 3608]
MRSFVTLLLSSRLILLPVGGGSFTFAQQVADPGLDPSDGYSRCENQCKASFENSPFVPVQLNISCDAVNDFTCLNYDYGFNRDDIEQEFGHIGYEDYQIMCAVRSWEKAGCKRGGECRKKYQSQQDMKKCCDDRWFIPYSLGPSYNGYMAGCAPDYSLTLDDAPNHRVTSCYNIQVILNRFKRMEEKRVRVDLEVYQLREWEWKGAKCATTSDENCCGNGAPSATAHLDRYMSKCEEARKDPGSAREIDIAVTKFQDTP